MTYVLAVDLGTTFTAAAIRVPGQRAEVVTLGTRVPAIPSVVFLREDGAWLVGEAAERRGGADPGRVARAFKRRFGDPVPVLVGGTPQSAEALTARLLEHVVRLVAERHGGPPAELVLTHPAAWGSYKVDLLRAAARLADVQAPTLVAEPVAAAAHYATLARVPEGAVIAVYDLGGGSFDATVVRRTATSYEVLGEPEGIERFGGVDIDEAVLDHVRAHAAAEVADLDAASASLLRRGCVEAKEALSGDDDAVVPVGGTTVRITRRELEERIRPALDDATAALLRAIRSAGLAPADLHAVLLVGGSSRIPIVGQLVAEATGATIAVDVDPEYAIALGATKAAEPEAPAERTAVLPVVPAAPHRRASRRTPLVLTSVIGLAAVVAAVAVFRDGGTDGDASPTSNPPPDVASVVVQEGGPQEGRLLLVDADGSDPRPFLEPGGIDWLPTISPDRTRVAYLHTDAPGEPGAAIFELRVATLDGEVVATLATGMPEDARPSWSPDGTRIVAARASEGSTDLFVFQADGSAEAVRLTDTPEEEKDPAWSPGGDTIAARVLVGAPLDYDLFLYDAETGERGEQLTQGPELDTDPWWSPDGQQLVFSRFEVVGAQLDQLGDGDLFLIDAERDVHALVDAPELDQDPVWLPDDRILFSRTQPETQRDIFVVGPDGGTATPFVVGSGNDQVPAG